MAVVYIGTQGGSGGGGVQDVTAGDTSIVVGGTAAHPTVETADLSVIAADHATAGDVAMNAHKLTGLANGSAATDAAAFGQIVGSVIFDSTLGANAASIDTGANGVPGGHGSLLILIMARTADAAVNGPVTVRFNGDSGANYDFQNLNALNTTVSATSNTAQTGVAFGLHGSGGGASYAGSAYLFVPAYDQTTFFKSGNTGVGRADSTAANQAQALQCFGWRNTAAITRVSVTGLTANLLAGSRMTIYGLT